VVLLLLVASAGSTCTLYFPTSFGIASLSPANQPTPGAADWSTYWLQMRGQGGFQGIYTQWDASGAGNIPEAIVTTAAAGFGSVVVLGITSALGDPGKTASLESMLAKLVTQEPVVYLGLGNEIDEEASFSAVAAFVNQLTDYVHSLGTAVPVFTVFQYEHLLGLPDAAARVAQLTSVDFVAFTTYPCLNYSSGAAVPRDYYQPIANWVHTAIAFTEVGWPSRSQNGPAYPDLHGSEQDQLAFIQTFQSAIADYGPFFANWFSLHDPAPWTEGTPVTSFNQVLTSAGLMANGSGPAKSALAAWLNRPAPLPE